MVEAKVVEITPKYVIANGMLPKRRGVSKHSMNIILNKYGNQIKKMLLAGKSYCVGSAGVNRKRVDVLLKSYERNKKLSLSLKIETPGGKLNKRILRIKPTYRFRDAMKATPVETRYLFPSL